MMPAAHSTQPTHDPRHEGADANPPVRIGERYGRREALDLLEKAPLGELMGLAHAARMKRLPRRQVSYVLDTNPNYTNVCETTCTFCAFCRPPGHPQAYTLTPEELAQRVIRAQRAGATTVLLQGGHNPVIGLKHWIDYIRAIREACPAIHIHPFSPTEYVYMAAREKMPVAEVMARIHAEGIRTIPGGGAEILVDDRRRRIAPRKATAQQWLDASETAHGLGFRTTATLMFGHIEASGDIITHLMRLRRLQDRTGGFQSFIPWSFKPGDSALSRDVLSGAHPAKYIRIIATARLVLDNFPHIQSSWFSETPSAGVLGLLAGADDFGGILMEEHVLREAGHSPSTTLVRVQALIRSAGFDPVPRDAHYRIGAD
ncbi:MAG: CofH family radical SAM protein [Desulfobacterales bacterium]|nr:CofH family radical SAM protein [Desulfobacterales bacterium]